MADEKAKAPETPPSDHHMLWEIAGIVLVFYIIVSLFNNTVSLLGLNNLFSHGLRGFTPSGLALSKTRPLSSVLNPINGQVLASSAKTEVYDSPGGKLIGRHKIGDYGRIIRGPITFEGEKYYFVDFEKKPSGWVKEKDLGFLDPVLKKLSSNAPLGSKVSNRGDIDIFDYPGGVKSFTKNTISKGKIVDGPMTVSGKTYFKIVFEDGVSGWVLSNDLDQINDGTRYLNKNDKVGTSVVTAFPNIDIFDEDGNQVDSQSNGIHGKIIGESRVINGEKYQLVEFEDGKKGYVKESDLRVLVEREKNLPEKLFEVFKIALLAFKILIAGLILFVLGFIVRIIKRLSAIRKNISEKLFPSLSNTESVKMVNPKWQRIMTNIESVNSADWKIAVLEADIMLDELLSTTVAHGDTVADKLKSIEKSDFTTIDLAWEAHKIRNRIAHDGESFVLTQRDARRAIDLYKQVFEEFAFI